MISVNEVSEQSQVLTTVGDMSTQQKKPQYETFSIRNVQKL